MSRPRHATIQEGMASRAYNSKAGRHISPSLIRSQEPAAGWRGSLFISHEDLGKCCRCLGENPQIAPARGERLRSILRDQHHILDLESPQTELVIGGLHAQHHPGLQNGGVAWGQ